MAEPDETRKATAAEFHEAMLNIYRRAIKEIKPPYRAKDFLSMVTEHGGVAAAKRLLRTSEKQSGFARLWEAGRLDLSMEAHVIQPRFSHLFTPAEVTSARGRLTKHGYKPA